MSKNKSSTPYEVGYGKPPMSGQFRPGVSGNKFGRPKQRPSLAMQLYSQLDQKITVTKDGKRKKITVREAVLMKAIGAALAGDAKARDFIFNVAPPSEAELRRGEPRPDYSKYTAEELANLYLQEVRKRR